MKLSEIFTQLSYGELSQVSIGGGSVGQIDDSNYEQILAHINLGLTALYKRFPLKENSFKLLIQEGKITYPLQSKYSISNTASTELVKYIEDTGNPFLDDILKIERVYTDYGYELGLNDLEDPDSVRTPSANVLLVPTSLSSTLTDGKIEVVYRANHPIIKIGMSPFNPEMIELELPYTHLEPLLLFVASRVHNPIGMTNEFNSGNNYASKYELSCQQLEMVNLRVDQGSQINRLKQNGWV